MPSPLERPLQLVTGKGGVGKSSIVAALALSAVARGRRPLIVELGHRATMESIFGVSPIGHDPREVVPGVCAMNIELTRAIGDYVARYIKVRAIADRIAQNAALARFFETAPGVVETVTLGKLQSLLATGRGSRRKYDPVIVDLDSTGHALMLLELPQVLEGLLGRGALRRMMRGARATLSDERVTALHLVTLSSSFVVKETLELLEALRERHSVPLGAIFVNQVPERPVAERSWRLLDTVAEQARDAGQLDVLRAAFVAQSSMNRYANAMTEIDRLRSATKQPPLLLPELEGNAPRAVVEQLVALVGHPTRESSG